MNLVKLSLNGSDQWINAESVDVIIKGIRLGSKLYLKGSEMPVNVDERPSDVAALVGKAVRYLEDFRRTRDVYVRESEGISVEVTGVVDANIASQENTLVGVDIRAFFDSLDVNARVVEDDD